MRHIILGTALAVATIAYNATGAPLQACAVAVLAAACIVDLIYTLTRKE